MTTAQSPGLALGGVPLARALRALRTLEPASRAFYAYDFDLLRERARRYQSALAPMGGLPAFALKANALPALLEELASLGFGADSASLGELTLADAAGFDAARRVFNGNGKTPEEAAWAATHGVHSVNADSVAELDLLERAAAPSGRRLRVALRVCPSIATPGHPYVAVGADDSKFGVAPEEALVAWSARARWPHLSLDGLHLHIGSQLLDPAPLDEAIAFACDLAAESGRRGAPLGLINLGGGAGVDYSGAAGEFPLEAFAARLVERTRGVAVDWVFEPGRWLVAPIGVLVAEVLGVKRRAGRRFVVLSAGMNDFLRPALYGAHHRIEPVVPRAGASESAVVVGPVCESGDVFEAAATLPPLEPGDLVAIRDVGAYGACMASNYNGRGRLAEVVLEGGRAVRVRAAETPEDLLARRTRDPIDA